MNHTPLIRCFSLGILLTPSGCTSPAMRHNSAKSAGDDAAECRAVTRAVRATIAADNAGDLQAALDCYTDDVVWIPPNSAPIAAKANIGQRYRTMYRDFRAELDLSITELIVAGDWAFVRGETAGRLVPHSGGESTPVDDNYSMMLRRVSPGEWKIARLMWNRRSQ